MSAFVVNKKCIDDVVTLLCNCIDKYKNKSKDNLGKLLIKTNVDAVNQLYNWNYEPLNYTYKKSDRHELSLYYNFCCLIYNCAVGSVTKRKIFKDCLSYKKDLLYYLFNKYINTENKKYDYMQERDLMHYMFDKICAYMSENNIEMKWGN